MAGVEAKSFDEPDDTVTFDHGRVDLLKFGSLAIGREVLEPGWRWSVHVKPIAGTERCEFQWPRDRHHGRRIPGDVRCSRTSHCLRARDRDDIA